MTTLNLTFRNDVAPPVPAGNRLDGFAQSFPQAVPATADWSNIFMELARMRTLTDDWDGDGSPAPAGELVDFALALAGMSSTIGLAQPDLVHAGVNGTIYFEWHAGDVYREMEVTSADAAEFRTLDKRTRHVESVALSRS